jgi:uncharacterized protein (DUF4415 family)
MPASKPAVRPSSDQFIGETDLAKVDAHVVQPHEYEELPELTDEMFERAVFCRNAADLDKFVESQQRLVLRLDNDVAAALRATGEGWEQRGNAVIRAWLKEQKV